MTLFQFVWPVKPKELKHCCTSKYFYYTTCIHEDSLEISQQHLSFEFLHSLDKSKDTWYYRAPCKQLWQACHAGFLLLSEREG